MFLLVKRSCFKYIPKDNEENIFHGRRQLGRLLNKLANSRGVSVVCGASHVGRGGGGVGKVSTISVFCQKKKKEPFVWDSVCHSEKCCQSCATGQEVVLEGETERCHSEAGSIQSLNKFTIFLKLVAFKNKAHVFYSM